MNQDDILPILQSLGIRPELLGKQKINKIIEFAQTIKNPSDISEQQIKQLMSIFDLNNNNPPQKKIKIHRNAVCNCGSGKKTKNCCYKIML